MDFCRNCKMQTRSFGEPKFVQKKNRWRRISLCRLCNLEKNNVSKSPETIELAELFKPYRVRFPTRQFIQKGMFDTLQADIYTFYRPKSEVKDPNYNFRNVRKEIKENDYRKLLRLNNGYKYILNIIDTFSKYAWAVPLKSKSGAEVAVALEKVMESLPIKPNKFHVDEGKEFYNKQVRNVLGKYDIEMYSTGTVNKASIVERFNRTLGDKLKPIVYSNLKWVDALPKIITKYNNTFHRTIKMKPSQVNKQNEKELLSTVYNFKISKSKPNFEIGDRVRLSTHVYIFKNKFKTNWTKEIFTVSNVLRSNVVYYNLEDITDGVYEEELQLTKL